MRFRNNNLLRNLSKYGVLLLILGFLAPAHAARELAPPRPAAGPAANDDCLVCHDDRTLSTKRGTRTVSLFVDGKKFAASVHAPLLCTSCHADLEGKDLPHSTPLAKVKCGACHTPEQEQHSRSLHGRALARGDALAPRCTTCHGNHEILPVKDMRSAVAPLRVPLLCGQCHREGTPVQMNRGIGQHNILENYSESIHGEALLRKGLIVAPSCISCHTAHAILPHTDPNSSIARRNIAETCTHCHAEIEQVHRKTIRGELWEKQANILPACVDCHQPHKIRNVFYAQGMADADCLRCHANEQLRAADGRPLAVHAGELAASGHAKVACSQCHSEVNASRVRSCETITRKVDCTACHEEIGQQFLRSKHGQLLAQGEPNAPSCKECHGTHRVLRQTRSRIPDLSHQRARPVCALPPRRTEGGGALRRHAARDHPPLHREHPRQGPAEERSHRDRHLHQLSHRARRAASFRSRLNGEPEKRARHLRRLPSRHPGAVRAERALGDGEQLRPAPCPSAAIATPPTPFSAPIRTGSSWKS